MQMDNVKDIDKIFDFEWDQALQIRMEGVKNV